MAGIRRVADTQLPTRWGVFRALAYEREVAGGARRIETAVALLMGDGGGVPLVRIHSQCFTGEILGSLRCDCGGQLEIAMQAIARAGRGLVIYEYQEGRGIGLAAKLQAYALQDAGLDTVDANTTLGFDDDERHYGVAARMLEQLGCTRVVLLTNNPAKLDGLTKAGIEIASRIPLDAPINADNLRYMTAKAARTGHQFDHLTALLADQP